MIIATHEMSFAAEIADHVVFLEEGLIVEEGPPQQVLKESQNDRTRQFLRRIELP
jgi:ABC-type polar amino acid transport system ATPase subunit